MRAAGGRNGVGGRSSGRAEEVPVGGRGGILDESETPLAKEHLELRDLCGPPAGLLACSFSRSEEGVRGSGAHFSRALLRALLGPRPCGGLCYTALGVNGDGYY